MTPAPRLALGFVAALLASCTVGPHFRAPHEAVPEHFAGATAGTTAGATAGTTAGTTASATAGATAATTAGATAGDTAGASGAGASPVAESEPDSFWWRQFHDRTLDDLETRAAAGNLDLKAAYLRIVQARIQVQSVRAQGLPSLNANASYTREQLGLKGILKTDGGAIEAGESASTQQLIHQLEQPVNLYQLGFDASWELDLFGKMRRGIEGAEAQGDSAVESRNDLLVSLEAEVAEMYFQLRSAQDLRRITLDLIAAQREVVELTDNRQVHGLALESDVQSARGQLSSLQAQLPPVDQSIASARHALAVLSGQEPEALDAAFGESGELPALPAMVPVGLPSGLARRRPDIRHSEALLHAATAQIGVAVAAFYPDITLAGTEGLRNTGTRYLLDWSSNFYTFGPKISLPIFQGGALVANVRLARAQEAEAALNYRKTVLSALQEVEDGLTAAAADALRTAALKGTVTADQRALDVDMNTYRHGIISYLTVLTAQIQLVQARQQLSQAMLTQSTDLVKLYKALGGGWETGTGS